MHSAAFDFFTFALAVAFAFGGLAVWPLYRRLRPEHPKRGLWLKGVFVSHLVSGALGFAYIAWAHIGNYGDAYMSPILLYLVGALSLVASCLVLVIGALGWRIDRPNSGTRSPE
jgi:4-amino-4-deoxy-L-arabinose transferase-like glycosyltransferase